MNAIARITSWLHHSFRIIRFRFRPFVEVEQLVEREPINGHAIEIAPEGDHHVEEAQAHHAEPSQQEPSTDDQASPRDGPQVAPEAAETAEGSLPQVARETPQDGPQAADEAVAERARKTHATKDTSQFYFREAILDQLDLYMSVLKRMRRADPSSYGLYRRIGAHVMPIDAFQWDAIMRRQEIELSPWWKQTRPAFGAVAFVHPRIEKFERMRDADNKRWIWPRFMYFTKYHEKPPSNVQAVRDGSVYTMTVYWDSHTTASKDKEFWARSKAGLASEFPVVINAEGDVVVLNTLIQDVQTIRHKHNNSQHARGTVGRVVHHRWGIPAHLRSWAAEHQTDPFQHLRHMFIMAANAYEEANLATVRCSVSKENLVGVFGIDVLRTPYFFKDREVTVTVNGSKARIFHIVRTHRRKTRNKITYVPCHFRGENEFAWNGYKVRLTVPGLDHTNVAEIDIPAASYDEGEDDEAMKHAITQPEFGAFLQEHLDGKPLHQTFEKHFGIDARGKRPEGERLYE